MVFRTLLGRVAAVAAVLLMLLAPAMAEHTTTTADPVAIAPGGKAEVKLTMVLDKGWYTYGTVERLDSFGIGPTPTSARLLDDKVLSGAGDLRASKPKTKFDEGFLIDIDYYPEKVELWVPVKAGADAKPGTYEAAFEVFYQVCDSARCLPPTADTIRVTYTIDPDAPTMGAVDPAAGGGDGVGKTESAKEVDDAKKQGIFGFLLFSMGAGFLALLTPCVFPMVPITVSFFTKRAEKRKGGGLRDSIVYSLGIISTFTVIGIVVALLFGASSIQTFASSPWLNLAIGAIFVALALNLFGVFELQVPHSILNKLNAASNEGNGIGSVLLMGLTFSLTSFTCTVPLVSTVLISVADGERLAPIIGMLGYSLAFASPFFLLSLMPSYLTKLPRAGGWMNNVKVVMGLLEIAAAMKFFSNSDLSWQWGVISPELFLAIWVGVGIMSAMYILGVFKLPHDAPIQAVSATRMMLALVFTSFSVYLVGGMFGNSLGELEAFIPPRNYEQVMQVGKGGGEISVAEPVGGAAGRQGRKAPSAHEGWIDDYDKALAVAKEEKKLVFVDFTGFTCTNCRWMEANMFPTPEVEGYLSGMVKVQLYTDFEKNLKLQKDKFGSIELPLYAIVTPEGEIIATKAFTRDKTEFLQFLAKSKETTLSTL